MKEYFIKNSIFSFIQRFHLHLYCLKSLIVATKIHFQNKVVMELTIPGWPAKLLQKIQVQSKNISMIFHENSSTINCTKTFLHNLT